jgi:starvation-inducible DNA-binding protein
MNLKDFMMSTTILGLDRQKVEGLTKNLNELLANFQVYYQNLRGLHWNIKGKSFFELHVKFEELYTDSQEKIDMIAERILTLEGTPLHTFEDYSSLAKVPVGKNISNDSESLQLIVTALTTLIEIERGILNKSDEADDEGTNSMMSDFIAEQEKTVWMLKAWLA